MRPTRAFNPATHFVLALGGVLGLLGAGSLAFGGESVRLSFEDLPRLVRERNNQAKAADANVKAAVERSGGLRRSFLPRVHAEAGYESFETGTFDREDQPFGAAEARANVYRGGRDKAEEKLTDANIQSAQAQFVRTVGEAVEAARKHYWDLVFNREMIEVLTSAIARNEENLASAKRRLQRGLTTGTDQVEFELHGVQLEERRHSFVHELVIIEAALAPIVGSPVGTRFDTPSENPIKPDAFNFPAPSLTTTPDVLEAEAARQSARVQARLSSWWAPTLDVYGGYALYTIRDREYSERSNRDDKFVGGRLELPLFDGGRSRLLQRSFLGQADAKEFQRRYFEEAAAADQVRRLEELKHELDLVRSSEKQLELGRRYLRGTLDEYGRGVKNGPDVVNALDTIVDLNQRHAERRRNVRHLEAALLKRSER